MLKTNEGIEKLKGGATPTKHIRSTSDYMNTLLSSVNKNADGANPLEGSFRGHSSSTYHPNVKKTIKGGAGRRAKEVGNVNANQSMVYGSALLD